MCSKKGYKDKQLALSAMKLIHKAPNDGKKPIRAYLCPECGKYHLTSKKKDY